jgi:TRAP-type C4-dicarboxylate transport system permease small subunit
MAAACIAAREGQHFIFRWATLALSEGQRFWLRRIVDTFAVFLLAVILKYSVDYINIVAGQNASGTGLNMQIPYAAITFGSASLIVIYITEILDALLSLRTRRAMSQRERNEAVIYGQLGATPTDKKS